jgi:hypothetical protein
MPSKNLEQMLAIRAEYGREKEAGKDVHKLKHWINEDKKKFGKEAIGRMISNRLKARKG